MSQFPPLWSNIFYSEEQKYLELSRVKKWICSKKPRCSRIRALKRFKYYIYY